MDLYAHGEVVAEGAQTILRAAGKPDAYESLRQKTRGRVLTQADYESWCDSLDVDDKPRARLKKLWSETYIRLVIELTDRVVGERMKLATLVLEDGTVLEGRSFGAATDAVFELVFSTSMTAYQEILTDPSYRG